MATLGVLVFTIGVYFLLGPLIALIGARVVLWLGRALDLPDALGVFGAEVARAFRAHAKLLDREMGTRP